MFAIRDDRDFVTQDDFMKGARKLQEVSWPCLSSDLGDRTDDVLLLRRRSTRVRVITPLCSCVLAMCNLSSKNYERKENLCCGCEKDSWSRAASCSLALPPQPRLARSLSL